MKKEKKVGVALGGGGARGFCHVGVLEVLHENGIPIDVVTGCSMGALVGGGFAAGVPFEEIYEAAKKVKNTTVLDIDLFHLNQGGIAAGERAMKLYRKMVGEERLIEECNIKFACIATDLTECKLHVFKSGILWQAVRASMAIPGVFQPMRLDGRVFVDGGVLKRVPISEARDLGADIVIAVDAIGPPWEQTKINSVMKTIEAAFMLLDWKSTRTETASADILITPKMGDKSVFSFKNNEEAIRAGREAAIYALPQIKKLLGME